MIRSQSNFAELRTGGGRTGRRGYRQAGVRALIWRVDPLGCERGQAPLLLLGVVVVLLAGLLVLFAFGQAHGAKGRHQRAADLAAVSAAQVMRHNYARLFEPPLLPNGLPNPRHLLTPPIWPWPGRRRGGAPPATGCPRRAWR